MEKDFKAGINEVANLFCADPIDAKNIEENIYQILLSIGENPERDGLKRTPERVARSYTELLEGYRVDPVALINDALFDVDYHEPVLVRDIEFYSMCEHHLLPIIGRAHVEYIPNGKIIGLSKIPRIVDMFSRRLQVQERMTKQIAEFINHLLNPTGVAVIVEGLHLCSMIRGVQKHNARMTTSSMHGIYQSDSFRRKEFMENISRAAESLHI